MDSGYKGRPRCFSAVLFMGDRGVAARTDFLGPTAARYSNQEYLMQKPLPFMEQMEVYCPKEVRPDYD